MSASFAAPVHAYERIAPTPEGIGGAGDHTGAAAAIFGDTAAIGAPSAQIAVNSIPGVVEVFRLAGTTWQREAIVLPNAPLNQMRFGSALALGQNLLVVQAADAAVGNTSSVFTFERDAGAWSQVDAFTLEGASAGLRISGDRLLVGNERVYRRSGAGWALEAQLAVDDNEYAGAGAMDGDVAALTSRRSVSFGVTQVFVNIYANSGGSWTRTSKILLNAPGASSASSGAVDVSAGTVLVAVDQDLRAYVEGADGWALQGSFQPFIGARVDAVKLALRGNRVVIGTDTVYVFERSGSTWTRTAHFADPEGDSGSGTDSAIALGDDAIVFGLPYAYTTAGDAGKADVFALANGAWAPTAQLDFGNAHRNEEFGRAISVDADTLLVGAWRKPTIDPWVIGGAYVFERAGTHWNQVASLSPAFSAPSQFFGSAVALHAGVAAVGAGAEEGGGAVYLFARGDGSWPQQARMESNTDFNGYFGWSLCFLGDRLLVGEPAQIAPTEPIGPGRVRAYTQSGGTWDEQTAIEAGDGANGDEFGFALASDGDSVIVGAPRADVGIEQDAGAAYVYTASGTTWVEAAKLTAPLPTGNEIFGVSVAILGDTAVVGAGAEQSENSVHGAAYVYAHTGAGWVAQTTLTLPGDGTVPNSFGRNVAISPDGQVVLIAAPTGAQSGGTTGVVYRFVRDGADWRYAGSVQSPAPAPQFGGDGFGTAVAFDASAAMIGAPTDGLGGAVFTAPIGDPLFKDGFDTSD